MKTSENQTEKPYGVSNFSNFEQNQHIRLIEKEDGTPWFVAKDVCRNLGLTNVSMAVKGNPKTGDRGLDPDEIASIRISDTSSSTRNSITALCVNESGMYALTFKSRKPQAIKFRKWVTSEVLPSIRKTGSYAPQADPTPAEKYMQLLTAQINIGVTPTQAAKSALAIVQSNTPHARAENKPKAAPTPEAEAQQFRELFHSLADTATKDIQDFTISEIVAHARELDLLRPYVGHRTQRELSQNERIMLGRKLAQHIGTIQQRSDGMHYTFSRRDAVNRTNYRCRLATHAADL